MEVLKPMDTIAPTPERLAKGGVLRPANTQTERRDYYRHENLFDRLGRKEKLDGDQVAAGNKLERHWLGAMGVDVRVTDGNEGNPDVECAPIYHGQKIAEAMRAVPPRQWESLQMILNGCDELYAIGGALCQRKQQDQAAAAALVLVQEGLDVLVDLWGLKAGRYRPPSR